MSASAPRECGGAQKLAACFLLLPPVLHRFGEMGGADLLGFGQIGDDAVVGSSGEAQPVYRAAKELAARLVQRAKACDLALAG